MKSLKTKVIMSAFVLLFALVATIGSTYAWFTVTDTVTVNSMNIDVESQDSLLIRIYDGEDQATANTWMSDVSTYFKSVVTSADLTGATSAGYDALATWKLTPLTAATGATGDATDYSGLDPAALSYLTDPTVTTDRALTATTVLDDENTSEGGYIELKFWVVSQSVANDIMLKDLSITAATGDTTPIANAVRLATLEDTGGIKTVFGIGTDYGFSFPTDYEGWSDSALDSVVTPATLVSAHGSYLDTLGNTTFTDRTTTVATATKIAGLLADVPELISVRIWIEGWDAQTTNSIIAASFDISFKFAIKTE